MRTLLTTMKARISPIWTAAMRQFDHGKQWLTRPRGPIDWKAIRTSAGSRLTPESMASRAVTVGILIVILVAVAPWLWKIYSNNLPSIIPLGAAIGGAALAWAALAQAATARRRHKEQTDADRQRRITESFSRATEQLGSDKIEMRLGGIYTLERISRESSDDYWTVMETLVAFVRERASWNEVARRVSARAYFLWQDAGRPDGRGDEHWCKAVATTEPTQPPTDVAAVLTVIVRRPETEQSREKQQSWRFDLRGADLRGAKLGEAHLERALLYGAHLEGAHLAGAHLEGAYLHEAHFEGATSTGHISKVPSSLGRISNAPCFTGRISMAPTSSRHISKAPPSTGRISKAPASPGRTWKVPISAGHISKALT